MGSAYDVIFENKKFVAFGQGANVSVSSNGIDWISGYMDGSYPEVWMTPFSTDGILKITHGKGKWLAVIAPHYLVVSPNLFGPWRVPEQFWSGLDINDSVFGRQGFVALASYGYIANSDDSATWSVGIIPNQPWMAHIAYGNGSYVAVGLEGIASISKSGFDWESVQLPTTSNLITVGFSQGVFLTVAEGGEAFQSCDGRTWHSRGNTRTYWPKVLPSRRGFHIVDQSSEFRRSSMSRKGVISDSTLPLGTTGLARGRRISVAVGKVGAGSRFLATSRNEREWTIHSEQFTEAQSITGIDRVNGRFVVISDSGDVAVTEDFQSFSRVWSARTRLTSIASSPEICIIVGERGTILSSEDGRHFGLQFPLGATNDFRRVKFAGDRFFAFTQSELFQSKDGKTWNSTSSPPGYWNDVEFGNGMYVLARGDTFRVSADGETWDDPNNGDCCGVDILMYANGRFYGIWGEFLYSFGHPANASVRLELIGNQPLRVISPFEGGLLVYGDHGEAHYARDGTTWMKSAGSPLMRVHAMVVHEGLVYLTGSQSGIVRGIAPTVPEIRSAVPR